MTDPSDLTVAATIEAFQRRAEGVKTAAILIVVFAVAGGGVAMAIQRDGERPHFTVGIALAAGGLVGGLLLWLVAAWAVEWARHADRR